MRHVHGLLIIVASLSLSLVATAESDHGTPPTTRRENTAATPLRDQAKHIFKGKCADCHGGGDGDPYGAFDMDGLPKPDKIAKVMERMNRPEAQRGHMPPKGEDQVNEREKKVLDDWAAGEKKEEPPKQTCEVLQMPNLKLRPAEIMGDGQAFQIMKQVCTACHGTMFSVTPLHPIQGAGKLAANALRMPHTKFLNDDGSFNAEAIASGKETVGRVLNQIVGVDGKAFMPPGMTPKAMTKHYGEADRGRLTKWLQQQLTDDLPKGCQVFAIKKPTPKAMSYADAQKACSDNGSRMPNIDQLKKLEGDLKADFGGKGCVWSGSFSTDEKMPRQIWSYDGENGKPTVGKAASSANCFAACIR